LTQYHCGCVIVAFHRFIGDYRLHGKIVVLLVASLLGVSGCHRAPDSDYLRDYALARDLIDTYHGNGDELYRARLLVDTLLKKRPDLPQAHVEQARLLMNRGHMVGDKFEPGTLENAVEELHTAISLDADFCDAHVVLSHVLYRMHRYPDALQALDRADALSCPTPWRVINRVEVDLALQRFNDAEAALGNVPATLANSTPSLRATIENRVLSDRVWIAYQKGDRDGILNYLREQLKAASADDAWSVGNTVPNFVLAGSFDEAVSAAHEALRRMNYPAAERSLGVALLGKAIWDSSRVGANGNPTTAPEWTEAETHADFVDAGKELWGSLANRDNAFRALLQAKLSEYKKPTQRRDSQK
jgi:tetratricopeptide (TPR) repeat protein